MTRYALLPLTLVLVFGCGDDVVDDGPETYRRPYHADTGAPDTQDVEACDVPIPTCHPACSPGFYCGHDHVCRPISYELEEAWRSPE
jgi:hypothetical protein